MERHEEHEHLEQICAVAADAVSEISALPSTRVLVIAAEPCGCHVLSGTLMQPVELIGLLMHVARNVAEEAGGSLTVSGLAHAPGLQAEGPAA